MFAEVYQGQNLKDGEDLATSVSSLMRKIIEQLEERLKSDEQYGWESAKPFLIKAMISYSRFVFEGGSQSVEHDDLLRVLKASCVELSEMNSSQLNHIVKGFVSDGLLDKRIPAGETAFDEDQIYYYPANQSVMDFMIARSGIEVVEKNESE